MPPTVLAWDGVTAVVPPTKKAPAKTILSSATGVVRAGAGGGLCAVLGPSGSGKTTLLTILAGHEPPASGRLMLDGAPYDARTAARVGFVPQVDQLFSTLTVLETLEFAQEMRNGATPAKKAGATGRKDAYGSGVVDAAAVSVSISSESATISHSIDVGESTSGGSSKAQIEMQQAPSATSEAPKVVEDFEETKI